MIRAENNRPLSRQPNMFDLGAASTEFRTNIVTFGDVKELETRAALQDGIDAFVGLAVASHLEKPQLVHGFCNGQGVLILPCLP
jgi:hypothetical protein